MKKSLIKHSLLLLGGVAFLIAVWITAYFCVGNPLLLPSFGETVKQFFLLWIDGAFWGALGVTLLRVVVAFVLSFVLAVITSVLSYLYPSFRAFFAPVLAVLRSMPVLAVLLVILVWTNGGVAPVIVAFLSLYPILYTQTLTAICGVDDKLLQMSKAYRVPRSMQITKLYIPSVAPALIKACGSALGFGVKLIVSAEVLARSKHSLGVLMQDARGVDLPQLVALVIVACVLGFALECLFTYMATRMQRGAK